MLCCDKSDLRCASLSAVRDRQAPRRLRVPFFAYFFGARKKVGRQRHGRHGVANAYKAIDNGLSPDAVCHLNVLTSVIHQQTIPIPQEATRFPFTALPRIAISLMQYHLAQLKAFCEAHPMEAKVLIVPAMTVGHDLAMGLAAAGYSWMNLQIETPRSLAEKDASARLVADGHSRLAQDADLFWLDEMIPQAVREVEDDYFTQQAAALTRPFLRTLRVLRAAGLQPDSLSGERARHRLLQRLYRAYCAAFERDHLYDNAILYRRAIEHLKSSAHNIHHAILDETPLPSLAFLYVRERSQGRIWRIGRKNMGALPPPHSAAMRFADIPLPNVEGNVGVGGNAFISGLAPKDASQIRLCETLGTETEIRTVLRDIRSGLIPLDAVEIVYTSEIPYLSLLCDAIQQFGLNATYAEGLPVATTRTGQALVSFYRWLGAGCRADDLIAICRAGLIASEDAPAVATVIQRARIGEDLLRDFHALNKMKTALRARGDDDAARQITPGEIEAVTEELKRLFDLIPQGPSVSLGALVDAGLQFLEHFAKAEDNDVLTAITDRLRHVARSVRRKAPARQLANRLAELTTNLSFRSEAAKPGHLSIAPLSRAGYANRTHIYVVGMDESTFPGGATEDPLLLDGERGGVSSELELRRTRPAEQVWHLIRVLGMASNKLTLLSCRQNLSDGRERYPAALFQQAAEQMAIAPIPVARVLPEDPAQALDDAEALLLHYPSADYTSVVNRAFPWLVSGQNARRAREWHGLTTCDGWLGAPTPELAITAQHGIFSPSKLEMLARCPYRYFLRHVLGILPTEETEADPTRWLDPLSYGALLHSLFHKFMQTLKARGERPDREQHSALIQSLLKREIEKQKETHPVEHQAAYHADVKRLSQAAQVFLAVESDEKNADPIGFEVSFGFGESGGLNNEAPVTLELSDDVAFRIRGRIDRVDRVEDDFAIWDYKTGSMAQYDERDLLKRGTHLQWALYAYALEAILKHREPGRVQMSGYVFPGDREHGRRLSDTPPAPETLGNILRPLLELVANGGFFHVQKSHECDYCIYNRVCGGERLDANALAAACETMADDSDFAPLLDSLNRWMGI